MRRAQRAEADGALIRLRRASQQNLARRLYLERWPRLGLPPIVKKLTLVLLGIAWIIMACFTTFKGPWTTTGNGYFASWGGGLVCFALAFGLDKSSSPAVHAAEAPKMSSYSSSSSAFQTNGS